MYFFTKVKEEISSLSLNWRKEISAGFILFLIALPLSVGIAIASGAPPSAGIIAAVIGGILGSIFSGGHVMINGPAAGLSVILLAAIQDLGQGNGLLGFRFALAATVVAGGLQVLFGFLGVGSLGLAFPSAAIHGLLAAIGAIIMAKQFHVLMGVTPSGKTIVSLIGEVPHSIMNMNPAIALIGLGSLALLVGLTLTRLRTLKAIPAPLAAVAFGVGAGFLFDLHHSHKVMLLNHAFDLSPSFLLTVPQTLANFIILPDFSQVLSAGSIQAIITIALVASIESTLSAHAVDTLDPRRRKTNFNSDLVGKGFCNMICGAIGGLPIITEIVRSSANVANGATTRWSNFFHGAFILFFVALFPLVLHDIPLAALAAILLVVGFRLAHPRTFRHMWHMGWDQFVVFAITFTVCLMTDILVGVLVGFALELMLNAVRTQRLQELFRLRANVKDDGDSALISVKGPAVFSNFLALKRKIDAYVGSMNVKVDLRSARLVDHTVMEHLKRYLDESADKVYDFDIVFSRIHRPVAAHPLAGRLRTLRPRPEAEPVAVVVTKGLEVNDAGSVDFDS